jgi:uncharacterized membrane protein YdjX (TVP38/TMEM64 family)
MRKKGKKQTKWPLVISLGLVGIMVGCYFLWPAFHDGMNEAYDVLTSDDKERVREWVSQFGFWGPVVVIVIMISQMFLFVIPSVLVMVVTVLAYGPFWGSVLAIAGVLTASSIGYAIGNYLGPVTVRKLIGHKTEKKVAKYVEDYGLWAVVIARLSPVLSNDATSFVGGLLQMGYLKFIGATLLGILPLTIGIAYLGKDIDRLESGLIWISAISLAGFIAYIVYDRRLKSRKAETS